MPELFQNKSIYQVLTLIPIYKYYMSKIEFIPVQNKYTKLYFDIINARLRTPVTGYTERHHIHPYSLGGSNCKSNFVSLTAREHYICHLLLTKMLTGEAKRSMHFAFCSMQRKKAGMERYVPNSHIYSIVRKKIDRTPSAETRLKMSISGKNKIKPNVAQRANIAKAVKKSYTPELIAKRTEQFKNQIFSDEHRAKISAAKTGKKRSETSKQKQSASVTGKNNARSKHWTLLDPKGNVIKTNELGLFCIENNLSYGSLRGRGYHKDLRPVKCGLSIGWAVLNCYMVDAKNAK